MMNAIPKRAGMYLTVAFAKAKTVSSTISLFASYHIFAYHKAESAGWGQCCEQGGGICFSLLCIQSTRIIALSIMSGWHCLKSFEIFVAWKTHKTYSHTHKVGTGENAKGWQAQSSQRQALKRSVRLSLTPASRRHAPKKSVNSQKLCVCGQTEVLLFWVS